MEEFPRLLSELQNVQTIAEGSSIRMLSQIEKRFGQGCWRKMKGIAMIETAQGQIGLAEVHWYEAHGIGRHMMKRKRWVNPQTVI